MPKFEDAAEYQQALLSCYRAVQFIVNLRLDDLARAQQHAGSVGWVLDPTLYRANLDKLQEDIAVVTALRRAVAALPDPMLAQLRRGTTDVASVR